MKIKFIANSQDYYETYPYPIPASENKPSWYAKMPSFINDKLEVDVSSGDPMGTVKICMPFLDAMGAGYHFPLPCDIWVKKIGNQVTFKPASDTLELISGHDKKQYEHYPIDDIYYDMVFKWINNWIVNTPKGWSCLFTHPLHYDELPFKVLSGVVDTDKFPQPVNFAFLFKKDFEGLLKKGTPIAQVIPFKRETFIHEYNHDTGFFRKIWNKAHTEFFFRYKKNFWFPKIYKQKSCPFS